MAFVFSIVVFFLDHYCVGGISNKHWFSFFLCTFVETTLSMSAGCFVVADVICKKLGSANYLNKTKYRSDQSVLESKPRIS